jgi:hypothetical protein
VRPRRSRSGASSSRGCGVPSPSRPLLRPESATSRRRPARLPQAMCCESACKVLARCCEGACNVLMRPPREGTWIQKRVYKSRSVTLCYILSRIDEVCKRFFTACALFLGPEPKAVRMVVGPSTSTSPQTRPVHRPDPSLVDRGCERGSGRCKGRNYGWCPNEK